MGMFKNSILRLLNKSAIDLEKKVGTENLSDRENWLEKTLRELPAGIKILDAGAGELQYKKFCSHLDYLSQDFGKYDGNGNQEGLQTKTWDNAKLDIVSDIISIPVEGKSFDAIMCIEVFEHLSQPALAIREFSRILKKGGKLILTAPFCSLTHFAPHYYANGYSKYWYEKVLVENGFEIEEIVPNGNYFEYMAQELRRLSDVSAKYSSYSFSEEEQMYVDIFLEKLEKMSRKDSGSHDLLNFGYHVKAKLL